MEKISPLSWPLRMKARLVIMYACGERETFARVGASTEHGDDELVVRKLAPILNWPNIAAII